MISQIKSFDVLQQSYSNIVDWLIKSLFWLINKIQSVRTNQIGTLEEVERSLNCLNKILEKIDQIFEKNIKLLNDFVSKVSSGLLMGNKF